MYRCKWTQKRNSSNIKRNWKEKLLQGNSLGYSENDKWNIEYIFSLNLVTTSVVNTHLLEFSIWLQKSDSKFVSGNFFAFIYQSNHLIRHWSVFRLTLITYQCSCFFFLKLYILCCVFMRINWKKLNLTWNLQSIFLILYISFETFTKCFFFHKELNFNTVVSHRLELQ